MKVRDLMTRNPVRCRPATDLRAAAHLMWDGDFGVVPVVDDYDEVVGLVTDRDISMAMGTQNRSPSEIMVHEVMSNTVVQCSASDSLEGAMALMKEHQVRRLPVTHHGKLQGVISLNDILVEGHAVQDEEITATLRAISRHRGMPESVSTVKVPEKL